MICLTDGVFDPLPDNLSLAPPVQTPRRQEGTSESGKHLWKLPKTTSGLKQNSAETKKTTNIGSTKGVNLELSEH